MNANANMIRNSNMSLNNMNNNMMMNNYMNMNNNPMMNQNMMPPKVIIMRQNTSPNMQMGQNMMNQQMQKIINMGNYQTGANNNKIGPNLQNEKYIQSNDLISESLISSGDNYKCTKDKNDLLNTLNSFLGQMEIQTKSFKKTNNIKDPVFELIQNEEKKEVINFFSKNKNNFMDKMFKYFSSQRMSISPNLASKVIDSENGYQIYHQKVDNLISILTQGKKHFQIKYLTVMVLGKSGVGKTSLINKILNINAPTGEGKFVTKETTPYISNAMPFLRLVDTRGIEIAQQFGIQKMEEEAVKFIDEQLKTGNYNNYVHCIWYCVSGKRFEDVEINALNRIRAFYQGNKIPIIMVYTQSVDEESIERLKKYILKSIDCNDFVKVLAHDIKSVGHQVIKSFGIEELISKTLARCKEALNGDMRAVMTNQIITKLEKELIIENNKIRKYIFERTILKFIKGYDVQSDDNFLKRIITIYGYNIHYYLGKDISEQTSSLIRDNDAIMNYAIN